MSIVDEIRKSAEIRRAEDARQNFLSQVGTPGIDTLVQANPGGLMSDISSPGRGILGQGNIDPVDLNTQVALARISSGLDVDGGVSALQSGMEQRIQDQQEQAQFNAQLQQQQGNIDIDNQDQARRLEIANENLIMAQTNAKADAEKHTLDMLIKQDQFDNLPDERQREIAKFEMAQIEFGQLAPQEQAQLLNFGKNMAQVETQMNIYKPSFAINASTEISGGISMAVMERSDAKTPDDLAKKEFWRNEIDYASRLLKERSGSAVNESEYKRLQPTFINATDDNNTIIDKLKKRRALQAEDRARWRKSFHAGKKETIGAPNAFQLPETFKGAGDEVDPALYDQIQGL